MLETEVVKIIILKMYKDPEKTADEIDTNLRTLPKIYRVCLQNRVEDNPYTKEPEGNYVSDEGSD